MRIRKVLPPGVEALRVSPPPISSTSRRLKGRPSPVPSPCDPPPCAYRSKTVLWSSSAMPQPLSVTSSSMEVPARRALTRTDPSSGVNLIARSEEHTSELQSHSDLVCRLLLEKKKHSESPAACVNLITCHRPRIAWPNVCRRTRESR